MLRAALELTSALGGGSPCALVWQEPGGALHHVGTGEEQPHDDVLRGWLAAAERVAAGTVAVGAGAGAGAEAGVEAGAGAEAADAEAGAGAEAGTGARVAPVRDADGALLGALVLGDGGPDGGAADAALERVAGPVQRFLRVALERTQQAAERGSAYEALVEIGTQIQAEEVHADAVFELIVERARELCDTDVAWLALVDEHAEEVRVVVTAGGTTEAFGQMAVRLGTGIGGAAVLQGRTIQVRDQELYGNEMPAAVHNALAGEGVVSVLCSPMLRAGRMVGALYVGMRRASDFGPGAPGLLSALASQAAIAIENGRLYRALAEKNETLERSFAIHRELTDASLAGEGLDQLGRKLAQLVGRDVVVARADGATLPRRYPCDPDAEAVVVALDDDGPAPAQEAVGVIADEARLGTIHAAGDEPLSALQRSALEHGATVIALELVKQRAALEVEWRLQGELLEEILRSGATPGESLVARAAHFGIELERPRRVAVLEPVGDVEEGRLLQLTRLALAAGGGEPALVCKRGARVVVAIPEAEHDAALARVAALQRKAARAGVELLGGLSDGRLDLGTSLREAEAALGLARSGARDGGRSLVSCEALGPLRFLLDAPDMTEMRALVRRVLGPLAEHDAQRPRTQLLPTLAAYLEADCHQPTTAAACHIHVSTLKYRLARISAVLGCNPREPAARFELQLALSVLDVLRALGSDPLADSSGRDETAAGEASGRDGDRPRARR
ncbi:helix-turn-helix domain-containing protein [Conexibacter arvalis]|uniref:Sugar diacid utilization regulator/GAF domain-containing protein n=1 Tax=Conexibacter arvalis TaxID=912552 RepID=A0A840IDI8_9ACTN|nr:helix-turn-helix domain-containing protein [Conexibacter arvalis]MBB4662866.1 sugar diacid utilization regulator/GAF domain-containing protein [Conexibacter arvalis]